MTKVGGLTSEINRQRSEIVGQDKQGVILMNKNFVGLTLSALLLALSVYAQAQQAEKVPRIGYLTGTFLSGMAARTEALRQGLRDLGYIEGKNIVIEWRGADGIRDRRSVLAAELVRLKVDLIVTGGSSTTRAAKEATSTIPIVMTNNPDPVANGFAASLARPGGNITGLTSLAAELSGKRLELLMMIVPKLNGVAVLGQSTNPGTAPSLKETEIAARMLGVQFHYMDVRSPKDIAIALQDARTVHAGAVLVLPSPVFVRQRKQIVDIMIMNRLPAIYHRPEFVEDGGLTSYSASPTDLSRRAATYVDKILKGARPADLPIEQPTRFEFVINLKTAKQIGLTIPQEVLYRADKVIR